MSAMIRWMAIVGITAGGCGGDGKDGKDGQDFVGMYQVTSHRSQMGLGTTVACSDAGAAVVGGPTYFALIVDTFLDDPSFITMQTCTAPGACTDTINTFNPGGPGLEELSANTQDLGDGTCNLHAGRATVSLVGDVAHVEVRTWFQGSVPQSDCSNLSRAEALRATPDCRSVEIWDGTGLARALR
jgi:hypothetical protein